MSKRLTKLPLTIAAVVSTGLLLGSCDGGPTDPAQELTPIRVTALTVGTAISTLVVEITADDINRRLVYNLEVVDDVATGTVAVPPGVARVFTVTAFDDQHNVTHEGSAETDVNPGSNPPLRIKLKPMPGQVEVIVTFGDYTVLVAPVSATIDAAVTDQLQLGVSVIDPDDEVVTDPQVQWATTDPSTATVTASGLVTGLADGNVTIVAMFNDIAGLSEVTLTGFGGPSGTWQPQSSGTTETLYDIWGSGAGDVYSVGALGTILHNDGTSWTAQTSGTPDEDLHGVWGSSAGIYAVGTNGTMLSEGGATWTGVATGTQEWLFDVAGTPGSFGALAVGSNGTLVYHDGTDWVAAAVTTEFLIGVWMAPDARWWSVGVNGTIMYYDGNLGPPVAQASGTGNDLYGVWGSSAANIYAVGTAGTILHYDGANWTAQTSGTVETLNGVWGSSAANIYAVGSNGTILHYDGTSWTALTSGTVETLSQVWGSSATNVYAVGTSGTILHYDGT
jgi:hypothetical protein